MHKESAAIFSHTSETLADVEEETSCDELKENVNQVLNFPSRLLDHNSIWAVASDLDDILVA